MSADFPCIYFEPDGKCRKFSSDVDFSYCVLGPCPEQKLSYADRIRASSDEQLALFCKELMFNDFKPACKKSTFFSAEHKPECDEDCVSCILRLLQQPADGEEDNND